jgi:hypothetical protein
MKIKIGDEFLDGGGVVAQSYEVNNLGDIANRQGGLSNTFTVPLSNKNKRLLGYVNNVNAASDKPYIRVPAQLYDNNTRVAVGYIKIVRANKEGFEVVFFSDNVAWFTLIKDKKLSDLDLSSLDHDYTRANIISSFTNTDGYIYPVIDYGLFAERVALEADVTEMFPAVFVKTIVDQIFKEIGWVATGEMFDEPMYDRMVLPFSLETLARTERSIIDNTVTDTLAVDDPLVGDGDIFIDVTSVIASDYTIDVTVVVDDLFLDARDELGVDIYVNGVSVSGLASITANGTYTFKRENQAVGSSIVVDLRAAFIGGSPGTESFTAAIGTTLTITPTEAIQDGNEIEVANTLPDISQTDFIKYLFNIFGIVPTADPISKIVSFDLFRNINKRLTSAVDWSSKIDVSQTIEVNFEELIQTYGQRSRFNYLEDSDDTLLQAYQSANNEAFGSGVLTIDNQHLEGNVDVYEAPFAPSINFVSFANTMYIPQIISRTPRVMLISDAPITVSELTGGNFSVFTVTSAVDGSGTAASIPFAWFAKAPYTPNTDIYLDSLSFGDIRFSALVEGTLSFYWQEYQEALNEMKYVRAFFRLDSVDIQNLDFTLPIYVSKFNAYFYLNKIVEFTGKDQVTEVEMVKIG